MAILTQVRDPRVRDVTVTGVEMEPDMRAATVHVSVMGSPAKQELAIRGLASSAGFLQAKVAERIETRYTPRLKFKLDGGVKRSIEIAKVLGEVLGESAAAGAGGHRVDGVAGAEDPAEDGVTAESPSHADRQAGSSTQPGDSA